MDRVLANMSMMGQQEVTIEFDLLVGLGNTGFDQDQEVTPRTPFTSKILWPILPNQECRARRARRLIPPRL